MAFTTVHYDDSGTDPNQRIAVAGCYIGKTDQWIEFSRNWGQVAKQEGFEQFHMAEFAANQTGSAFENWDDEKKERVLRRLCSIITTRASVGFATAVWKKDYDEVINGPFRQYCGEFHYTFALRQCAGRVGLWREKYHPKSSMRYIFDRMAKGEAKREINCVMDTAVARSEATYKATGVMPLAGFSFESKSVVLPLQAADILAWTIYQQMHRILFKKPARWEADMAYDLLKHSRSCPLDDGFFVKDNLLAWDNAEIDAVIADFKKRHPPDSQRV